MVCHFPQIVAYLSYMWHASCCSSRVADVKQRDSQTLRSPCCCVLWESAVDNDSVKHVRRPCLSDSGVVTMLASRESQESYRDAQCVDLRICCMCVCVCVCASVCVCVSEPGACHLCVARARPIGFLRTCTCAVTHLGVDLRRCCMCVCASLAHDYPQAGPGLGPVGAGGA